ncbi:ABC transporter permease [Nonomuraea sp. NPDC051941]|uniref:ABC transporter permease n=1 Tax=Nonomuraea sp. NPDC051941 TaxID=3364373 RepID=UPI0037C91713
MADFRSIYTWKTWSFAWLSRILCQVTFFSLIGRLFDDPLRVQFLLVGNAVHIVALAAMLVCASTAWERQAGTLPLLVASPAHPFPVFVGRSVQWLLDGTACATISLFLLGPLFGLNILLPGGLLVIPLIFLVGLSVYSFGLVLAGLALRKTELRNIIGTIGNLSLMAICGVQVPTSFWPEPIQFAAHILPLTHGLAAIRGVLAGFPPDRIVIEVALEVGVGLTWLLVASLVFQRLVEGGRKGNSLFAD